MKKISMLACLLYLLGSYFDAKSQSMLDSLETITPKKEYISNAFKSSRVINGHSMEFIGKGVLDFRILHRFGRVNQGVKELFGLDQASMRIGLDYGLGKNLTTGIGRTTTNKELDGFIKYRPVWQSKGAGSSPVSFVLIAGISINTVETTNPIKTQSLKARTGYYYQVIVGRKFSNKLTLQLSPTVVHRNVVPANEANDVYAIGAGGRLKISKRIALVADYFYIVKGLANKTFQNPLSVGIDIETGGHVFQLHFSNTRGMNERSFITETVNKWGNGDIQFGFNLSRVFTLHRKKVA